MLRKILVGLTALATAAVVAPAPAEAGHTQGVVVFAGNASVTPGLCFPGFEADGNDCGLEDDLDDLTTAPDSVWRFDIPGDPLPVIGTLCRARGSIGSDDACEIHADGLVYSNPAGVGPSCGMSGGDSDDDPTFVAPETDRITINGTDLPFRVEWLTSAGGTLPLTGEIDGEDFAGVVQARPINQNCATTSANQFTVVGATASAG